MNTEHITEILNELRKPFHPSQVTWRPGAVNSDQTRALGLAYADLRAYQNRLDEICGLNWSVSYTPWGDRIICHLTINGVTRSSTGEPDAQSERSEIAGTATEAQAFKRACAMFGLGRYLYHLPSVWVEYGRENRYFTEKGKQRLEQIVWQHYRNALNSGADEEAAPPAAEEPTPPTAQPAPATAQAEALAPKDSPPQAPEGTHNGNGATNGKHPEPDEEQMTRLQKQFHDLGQKLYGEQWAQVSRHNVERISEGQTNNSAQLSAEQIQRLIDGLKSLQRKRQRVKSNRTTTAAAA
jgi:hypothetical protein